MRELSRLAQELNCNLIRVFTAYDDLRTPHDQQWSLCVQQLRECARQAASFGVTLGVQNHHDTAVHHESLFDLLEEIGEPNCKAMFDAWAPALQGEDLATAVRKMAPYLVHTTVADYVRRPRFHYQPALVNYTRAADAVRARANASNSATAQRSIELFSSAVAFLRLSRCVECRPFRNGG